MKKFNVEVLEAASHPEGGYAVVLLHGLETIPDGASFRIKPVESRGHAATNPDAAWPAGDHRPLVVRKTAAGIELLIGPDIVECPALIPGTLGVIEIHAAGVRGEFIWPSIRPTARPRRRHLSVVKPQLPVANTATGEATRQPGITPEAQPAITATDGQALAGLSKARRPGQTPRAVSAEVRAAETLEIVPVTALDHAVPVAASHEQAVGAKIVPFDLQRDKPVSTAHAARSLSLDGVPAMAGSTADRARFPGWQRIAACAATVAVLISGSFLLFSARTHVTPGGSPGEVEIAAVEVQPSLSQPRAAEPPPSSPLPAEERSQPSANGSASPSAPSSPRSSDVALSATPPASQSNLEVTLRMRGGGFQITGDLKGFDGAKYVIETRSAGILTMDASRFECAGDACSRPAAAILSASERPSPAKPDTFRIEGSFALAAEFVPQLVKDYANSIGATVKELPGDTGTGSRYRIADPRGVELATIEVLHSTTAAAIVAVERGASAIALIDRALEPEPQARSRPAARLKTSTPQQLPTDLIVGLDAVTVIAAPASAPPSISIDQLAKVLSGQITDWYDLGLPHGAIQLYLPADGSGTMDTLARQVLRPRGLDVSRTAKRLATDVEAADAVSRDARGLGVVALASQRGAKAINLETTCGLVVRPTSFGVKTGEYPLIRKLSLHVPANVALPSARGLLRIAQSSDVQAAASAARLVDTSITSLPIEEQAERMAWAVNAPASAFDMAELRQMMTDFEGATRLSLTFRFIPGTADLDARSRADVARLAAVLKEPELAGRRILLAGFTDAAGRFQQNLATAQKRAGQIRASLATAAGPGFDGRLLVARGYGPLAPVACNGTPEGRARRSGSAR